MGALAAYAIQVAIVFVALYLVYKLALSGTTFYRFNRVAIFCCYILAFASIPLFGVSSSLMAGTAEPVDVGDVAVEVSFSVAGEPVMSTWWGVVPVLYVAGAIAALIYTLLAYLKIYRIIRSGDKKKCPDGCVIVVVDKPVAPFSWGRYVVLSREDAANELIVAHERAHSVSLHSVDLAVAQLFVVFNWFNPVAYLMHRELASVQEYEADLRVVDGGADAFEYQMLLIKKTAGAGFQSIANSLNHSQLKNRLTMMLKTKSKSVRRVAAAVLLPVGIIAAALTDVPAVAEVVNSVKTVTYADKSTQNSPTLPNSVSDSCTTGTLKVNGIAYLDDDRRIVIVPKSGDHQEFYVDGVLTPEDKLSTLSPDEIESITVLKDKSAVIITTRKHAALRAAESGQATMGSIKVIGVGAVKKDGQFAGLKAVSDEGNYYIDGVPSTKEQVDALNPEDIESVTVLKKDNALIITTKRASKNN